ncbi:MAG: hypothetical protein JNJ99_00710 [Crocinitomicaceae bacterium]|nr:hypothetical protein [Crocinitomicaceae bacterium]
MLKWILPVILCFAFNSRAQLTVKKLVELPDKMYETSGLVFYQDRYLLTHNDGGNDPEIFVLDIKTGTHRTIEIEGVKNNDWEDLTVDEDGRVFIGAFGNNLNKRERSFVYVLPKNFLEKDKVEPKKIEFIYEDQLNFPPSKKEMNFDCEAFFWANDSLYFFTKCRTEPYTGVSNIYVIPDKPGEYKAKKLGSIQLCSTDWRFCSVTAADYSEKYNLVALLTYSRLYLISDFKGHQFWNGKVKSYQLNLVRQREAICFKSKNSWYMTDEYKKGLGGGNLYEVKLKE